ncbi:MAG TPA: glycosyltransferase [Candidatus Saccharimonadales bacterium]|nr:glycosyltransferase [Candidatus Saccharimonadales bacterium]
MPDKKSPLKVAIVHDWLVGGGAERVVYELHQMFPDAPIYTSYCTDEWRQRLDGKVVTGFLQRWPFSKVRKFVGVLRIWWFTHLDLSGYDLVISSSGNGEAKGIRTPKGVTHICYCHAPTHYYWRHYDQYLKHPGFGVFDPLARLGLRLLVGPLRRWDLRASKRPDFFVANSTHTQAEIKQYYKRDSIVIHPPIDIHRFSPSKAGKTKRTGYVTAGRQTPYKRTDLIVEACTRLGVPLTVIGSGPEHSRLVSIAGPTVTFPSYVSDEEMPKHMAKAKAFLFAAYEDFGVTPVEALASGTPVIAYRRGGALDYVQEGKTGVFFDEQTVDSLCEAITRSEAETFNEQTIRRQAETFSPETFQKKLRDIIAKVTS